MRVTVIGVVNSDVCARGEQSTVEWTEQIGVFRRNGLIRIIEWHPDDTVAEHIAEGEREIAEGKNLRTLDELVATIKTGSDAWSLADAATTDAEEPPRTGKGSGRQAWVLFLTAQGVDVDDGATRDDLIRVWDSWQEP